MFLLIAVKFQNPFLASFSHLELELGWHKARKGVWVKGYKVGAAEEWFINSANFNT